MSKSTPGPNARMSRPSEAGLPEVSGAEPLLVLTVGHSTRSIEEFVALLRAHRVRRLVDVRTIPRSRRNPQFAIDSLPASLEAAGIEYVHMPGLGGLRHSRPNSINTGWRNASFRGYADYMQTEEFAAALQQLIELATDKRSAVMCAEAVPWRCHRSLIADALFARGIGVEHILSPTKRQPHKVTPFARIWGSSVTYPGEPDKSRASSSATSMRHSKASSKNIVTLS